jgi:hypothetical protein
LEEIVVNTTYDAEGVIQQSEATIANICWESCPLFIKVLVTSVLAVPVVHCYGDTFFV